MFDTYIDVFIITLILHKKVFKILFLWFVRLVNRYLIEKVGRSTLWITKYIGTNQIFILVRTLFKHTHYKAHFFTDFSFGEIQFVIMIFFRLFMKFNFFTYIRVRIQGWIWDNSSCNNWEKKVFLLSSFLYTLYSRYCLSPAVFLP